jgi:hypothetical protein
MVQDSLWMVLNVVFAPLRGIWLRLEIPEIVDELLTLEEQGQIALVLVNAMKKTAVPPLTQDFFFVPTNYEVVTAIIGCEEQEVQQLFLEFPAEELSETDLAILEHMVIDDDLLENIVITAVIEIEVAGREAVNKLDPVDSKDAGTRGRKGKPKRSKIGCATGKAGKARRLLKA